MISLRSYLIAAALLAATVAGPVRAAAVFTEGAVDAGNSLATAANSGAALSGISGPFLINGRLSLEPSAGPDYVDLFRFVIATPGPFTASTGSGFDPSILADPVLYLFNSAGVGVAMDDESGGDGQALLSLFLNPGTYFLAIAFAGVEPLDTLDDPIFDAFGSLAVLSTDPLGSWLDAPLAQNPSTAGAYSIRLQAVPLPGSLALVVAGLLAVSAVRTRNNPAA